MSSTAFRMAFVWDLLGNEGSTLDMDHMVHREAFQLKTRYAYLQILMER